MSKNKLKHPDIPVKKSKGSDTWVYHYRQIYNTNAFESKPTGYVYLHPHEKTEILYWLNRISCDIIQKRFLKEDWVKQLTIPQPKTIHKEPNPFYVGESKYVGEYNSIETFASGVAGNNLRNPHEDFGKAQLKFIQNAFNAIYWAYSETGPMGAEIGYSHLNRNELNERPLKIKFKEA